MCVGSPPLVMSTGYAPFLAYLAGRHGLSSEMELAGGRADYLRIGGLAAVLDEVVSARGRLPADGIDRLAPN